MAVPVLLCLPNPINNLNTRPQMFRCPSESCSIPAFVTRITGPPLPILQFNTDLWQRYEDWDAAAALERINDAFQSKQEVLVARLSPYERRCACARRSVRVAFYSLLLVSFAFLAHFGSTMAAHKGGEDEAVAILIGIVCTTLASMYAHSFLDKVRQLHWDRVHQALQEAVTEVSALPGIPHGCVQLVQLHQPGLSCALRLLRHSPHLPAVPVSDIHQPTHV
jgi:hypothetical protein